MAFCYHLNFVPVVRTCPNINIHISNYQKYCKKSVMKVVLLKVLMYGQHDKAFCYQKELCTTGIICLFT